MTEMHHAMGGPVLGNALVGIAGTIITLWVIVAAVRMLIVPGERDPNHPKYRVLRSDR